MSEGMPDPHQLCAKLARLHCEIHSPNGHFGFHITTCQGRIPQLVSWEKNWTTFFIKILQHAIDLDFEYNGPWDDLDKVEKRLISSVIPRLLGPLEKGGRKVKPSLIHADLWEGTCGTSKEGGNIYIFDAAAFYAHHEMDVANWRAYYSVICSANHLVDGKAVRQLAYNDMLYLIDKYAPFTGAERQLTLEASEMATLSCERDHTLT